MWPSTACLLAAWASWGRTGSGSGWQGFAIILRAELLHWGSRTTTQMIKFSARPAPALQADDDEDEGKLAEMLRQIKERRRREEEDQQFPDEVCACGLPEVVVFSQI